MKRVFFCFLFVFCSYAAQISWIFDFYNDGTQGQVKNWNDASNWFPAQVPTATDDVLVQQFVSGPSSNMYYFIQLPSTLSIKNLTHLSNLISLQGPCVLTVNTMYTTGGWFNNLDLKISGYAFAQELNLNQVDLEVTAGGGILNITGNYIDLGSSTTITNNNKISFYDISTISGDNAWNPQDSTLNCKFINNGEWTIVASDTRIDKVEIVQNAGGTLIVSATDEGVWFQETTGKPSGSTVETYNGAPSSWDGIFRIQTGTFTFYGGSHEWASTLVFDVWDGGVLFFGAIDGFIGIHNFTSNFTMNSGVFSYDIFTSITAHDISIKNLDWRGSEFRGSGKFEVKSLTCGIPTCCVTSNRQTLRNMTITGDSTPGPCAIYINSGAYLKINSGVTITAITDILKFYTDNIGYFLNEGTLRLRPIDPTAGPHTWETVFINKGLVQCVKSDLYYHCAQFTGYQLDEPSYSYGIWDIDSRATDPNQDFGRGWGPCEFGGPWHFEQGTTFNNSGLITMYGPGSSCSSDPPCIAQKTYYIEPKGTTYYIPTFRVDIRIVMYQEADVITNRFTWAGGYFGGAGMITIIDNGVIDDSGYGSGTDKYLTKTMIIKNQLTILNGNIIGVGGKIIIEPNATINVQSQIGTAATYSDFTVDLSIINYGTFQIIWGTDDVYIGLTKIFNYGTFLFENNANKYQQTGADPSYSFSDVPGQIYFGDNGTLVIRVRKRDSSGDDPSTFADSIDFYGASSCRLGGKLRIEIYTLTGCVPVCNTYTPAAGDTVRIFKQQSGSPCFGSFSTIEAGTGVPSGLKIGMIYSTPPDPSTDLTYMSLVFCSASDTTCGHSNPVTAPTGSPQGQNNPPSGQNNPPSGQNTRSPKSPGSNASILGASLVLVFVMFIFN